MAIKIERIVGPSLEQFQMAIEGMRIPMWSLDKSDSSFFEDPYSHGVVSEIGPADLALMRKLVKAGSDHRKFLRMLPVHMKITAPMVWLAQLDTYKVGTVSCGSSKMHRLFHKEFDYDDFGYGGVLFENIPRIIIEAVPILNSYRNIYLNSDNEEERARAWNDAIDGLPESYHQTRVLSMNYEALWSMYQARKNHKLGSWRTFCDTIVRKVPHFAEIFEIKDDGTI